MKKSLIALDGKRVLVTGAAGFIGAALVRRLLVEGRGIKVLGLDSLNSYYDVSLKQYRLQELDCVAKEQVGRAAWEFRQGYIEDAELVHSIMYTFKPELVVNLAAQAGVRWSIDHPVDYMTSNVMGFFNILEACRHSYEHGKGVKHLVFASSSSVYGANSKIPYSTDDMTDAPVSLYAATKKSNELMAYAYSKLYNIPATGLRFFTVYGPAGRPDMAYFKFTEKMRSGQDIEIYNYGKCERDFTYIDDVVDGIVRVMSKAPARQQGGDGLPVAPYSVYNIGMGHPVSLLDFIANLQVALKKERILPTDYDFRLHKKLMPMQVGDVSVTYADTEPLEQDYGYRPSTDLHAGLGRFAEWYRKFYGGTEAT